jgi:hypothetical protein
MIGNKTGDNTQNHGQLITLHSLNTTKAIVSKPKNPMPLPVLSLIISVITLDTFN